MHPAYFDTYFRGERPDGSWPNSFAVLSAYATTGSTWSRERNVSADEALERALRERGGWLHRLVGYSPRTQHEEPSWASEMSLVEACDLGRRFAQDAIYFVEKDLLFVIQCDVPDRSMLVDVFSRRLDPA